MKLLGLDYGITNSLLYEYSEGIAKEIGNIPSAVRVVEGTVVEVGKEVWDNPERDGNWNSDKGFVKSPRLNIDDLDSSTGGVTYEKMIGDFLSKMLEKNTDSNSHITMAIPNNYSEKNKKDIQEILSRCINTIFGNNQNKQEVKTHFIPEPIAAALYYTHKHLHDLPKDCLFVVCDLGAEATDLSIVELNKEKRNLTFRVIEGTQHASIGGNDFDLAMEKRFGDRLPNHLSRNNKKNLIGYIKCCLSIINQFNDFSVTINREEFIDSIKEILVKLEKLMTALLNESNVRLDNRKWYILPIGGTCRIPAVRECLEKVFIGAHQTHEEEANIFDCVAQGAAIYSAWCAEALEHCDYDIINIENQSSHDAIPYDPSTIIDRYMTCRNHLFSHASDDVDSNVLIYNTSKEELVVTLFNKTIKERHPIVNLIGSMRFKYDYLDEILADKKDVYGDLLDKTLLSELLQPAEYKKFINDISTKAIEDFNVKIAGKLRNIDVIAFSGSMASDQTIQKAVINAVKTFSKSEVVIPIYIDQTIN